ncbi:MAG: DUF4231 domain-containing protein, partial [Pseudomonadota bacterium]
LEKLLARWQRNCLRSQIANYEAANVFTKRNYWLGIPTIVLTTAVGTGIFASLQDENVSTWLKIVLGMISMLAAVLAALQTFFKWGELAAKFQAAGSEYGALKRELDQYLATGEPLTEDTVTSIRERMDTLSRDAPECPKKVWESARRKIPTAVSQSNK